MNLNLLLDFGPFGSAATCLMLFLHQRPGRLAERQARAKKNNK